MMSKRSDLLAQLRAWLRGEARRSDEARLEEGARTDEFLSDALSGYRAHPEHDHVAANERLRQRLRERTSRQRRIIPLWTRYAAGLALLIVAAGLFYWVNQSPDQNLAQERSVEPREQPTDTQRNETPDQVDDPAPTTTDEATEGGKDAEAPPGETPAQPRQETPPPPPPVAPPEEEAMTELDEDAGGDEMIESEELVREEMARDSRDLATQRKEQAEAAEAVPQEPIQRTEDQPSPPLADYSARSLERMPSDSLRSFRFVNPEGQPVAGAQLQLRTTRETLGQSNQQGFVQTTYQETPLQVQRQGYIPINLPPRTDTSALVVLYPVQANTFKDTRSRLRTDTTSVPIEAYPAVGRDSLTRYVQDRLPYPRRLLRVYFTVDTDGQLSNPEPGDDFSLRLFQILQEGPVWVVPVGVDSVRTSFRY
jgi:hypothetical protein